MTQKHKPTYTVAPLVTFDIDMSEPSSVPLGRGQTMEQLEAAAARRRRLTVAGLMLAALGLGIIIGRFLLG